MTAMMAKKTAIPTRNSLFKFHCWRPAVDLAIPSQRIRKGTKSCADDECDDQAGPPAKTHVSGSQDCYRQIHHQEERDGRDGRTVDLS